MPTLIDLSKILLPAVSVAGVSTVSALAIKNSIYNGTAQNKASGPDKKHSPIQPAAPHTATTQQTQITPPTKLSVVVVKQQTVPNPQTESQLSVSNESQSYKCRLKDASSTGSLSICKLVELTITNKWIDLAGIKQATQSNTLSLESLKNTPKQFKLEVSADLFAKVKPTTAKIVEIVSTTDPQVVHAELTTLFKADRNTVDYESVSSLLARAAHDYASIDVTKQKQCLLTDATESSQPHSCTFRSLVSSTASSSDTGYSNQTITNLEGSAPTSFTIGKYYLLDYVTPLAKTNLPGIYVSEDDKESGYQATLDSVVPVIFNGAGDHKIAFILA